MRGPGSGMFRGMLLTGGKSLLARIVSSFFLLSSLIVIALTLVGFLGYRNATRRQRIEQIEAIADLKTGSLDRWVSDQVRLTELLGTIPPVLQGAETLCDAAASVERRAESTRLLDSFIRNMLRRYPEVQAVSVLSATGGRVVYSTDPARLGAYRLLDSEFVQGLKGASIQKVHPSPVSLDPTMSVSLPLHRAGEGAYAVLVTYVNLHFMDSIIQDRAGLGSSGAAYLVDRYNTIVSAERFGRDSYPRGVRSAGIDAALDGINGSGSYKSYDGTPVIGAYRWVSDLDLALIVEVGQAEVFRSATRQSVVIVGFGLGLVALLATGVYMLARRLARPILAIQDAALRVAAGNLDATAPVLTHDEVGALARSFNHMTATVRRLYEELKGKEEYFHSLIDSSMDIVAIVGKDRTATFASPSALKITGYRPDELATMDLLTIVHADDRERLMGELGALLGDSDTVAYGLLARIVARDGTVHTIEANLRNLTGHAAIRGFVINARDVTERRELEDRLLQAQKMEAIGRLAGGVAHDFNNLLTVVIGYSETIGMGAGLDPSTRESIDEILKAAHRAAELTQQLLAYSRKQLLQPRVLDLNSLLDGMSGLLNRLIGEDVAVIMKPGHDLRTVKADPGQISQVVMNLVTNARDAMPDGGTMTIETGNALLDAEQCRENPDLEPGEYAMLAVSDTGCGMDEATLPLIFDPFFTTKGVGKGTGLGLAMVYGIITQSRGHIAVESAPGAGTTFRIYLPAALAEGTATQAADLHHSLSAGTETILVVEDEEPLRRMIGAVLGRAGYGVSTASSAEEAIPRAEAMERIDLLVSDIILPGANGRDMSRRIRQLHPGMRVLLISGYAENAAGHPLNGNDGTAFLQKPFSPSTLSRKVRAVLDGPSAV